MRRAGPFLLVLSCFLLASTFGGGFLRRRVELDSRQSPKVLPVDGDYPGMKRLPLPPSFHIRAGSEVGALPAGGTSGIPQDGYWPLDTAHGVTPYFSDPSVVYNANAIDFPYGAAARSMRLPRRQQVTI